MTADSRGERLDELNRATFRGNWRRIMDFGVGNDSQSALPGLLAALRANAEEVYGTGAGDARAKGRR